jgi:hypothetical protein
MTSHLGWFAGEQLIAITYFRSRYVPYRSNAESVTAIVKLRDACPNAGVR